MKAGHAVPGDMLADRHTHRQTRSSRYSAPLQGRSNNEEKRQRQKSSQLLSDAYLMDVSIDCEMRMQAPANVKIDDNNRQWPEIAALRSNQMKLICNRNLTRAKSTEKPDKNTMRKNAARKRTIRPTQRHRVKI